MCALQATPSARHSPRFAGCSSDGRTGSAAALIVMFTPIVMTDWPRFLPVFFGYADDNPVDVKFVDRIGLETCTDIRGL
jgi:hypothetical protein